MYVYEAAPRGASDGTFLLLLRLLLFGLGGHLGSRLLCLRVELVHVRSVLLARRHLLHMAAVEVVQLAWRYDRGSG